MHPYSYSEQKLMVGILHSCVNFSYLGYAKRPKKKRKKDMVYVQDGC